MLIFSVAGGASNDVKLADALKSKYKKFDVALKSSKNIYEFNYDAKSKSIYVMEYIEYEYVSLVSNARYDCLIPYDEFSRIEKVRLVNEKQSNIKITPVYSSYQVDGIFHSDAKLCAVRIIFSQKGEIRKIVAQKRYDDIRYFTRSVFQSGLPAVKKEIVFVIPSWFSLKLIPFNFDRLEIKQSDIKRTDGTRVVTYLAENVPHIPDEPLSDGPSFYNPHLLLYPENANKELKHSLMSTTALQYQWYKGLLNELNPKIETIAKKVDEVVAGSVSDLDKIEKIFSWVQDNIRYIAYEQGIMGFKPDEAHEVLNKKFGDCKGMANLLTQMLKVAGFDARFTWLGTNYLCYDYSVPSLAVDNHCITTLIYGNETYYLDATEKYLPMGMVAERIQGRQVMVEDGDRFLIKTIPQGKSGDNKRIQKAQFKIDGNQLIGNINLNFAGESRGELFHKFLMSKSDLHQKLIDELFHRTDNNMAVNESNYSDLFDVTKPFNVNANVTVNNKVSTFEKETYLIFDWEKILKTAQVKDDRETDLYFGRKFNIEKQIDFTIPSNLKVIHIPKMIEIDTPEYSINGKIVNKGNQLTYSLIIDIKNARINKDKFKQWNEAIKKLSAFYDDQIILTNN